jgi:hypothetical protein
VEEAGVRVEEVGAVALYWRKYPYEQQQEERRVLRMKEAGVRVEAN